MTLSPSEQQVAEFVYKLVITGAWLDEVVHGLCAELPSGSYPGENLRVVVLEMLCGTIGPALQSADARDLERAIELIDLAASRTEKHLHLVCDSSQRIRGEDGSAGRTDG